MKPATARLNSIAMTKMRANRMLIDMSCGSKSDTANRLRQVRHNESGFYPSDRLKSWLILRLAKSPIYGRKARILRAGRNPAVLSVGCGCNILRENASRRIPGISTANSSPTIPPFDEPSWPTRFESACYNRHNRSHLFRVRRKIGICTINPAEIAFKVLAFRQFLHLKTVKRRK